MKLLCQDQGSGQSCCLFDRENGSADCHFRQAHRSKFQKISDSLVDTTNNMAALSQEIEMTLQDFKNDFAMVKEETGTIAGYFQPN